MYTRKISSGTILAILALSSLVLLIPIGVVHGSTGTPVLGEVTSKAAGANFRSYSSPVSVVTVNAGTDNAALPNGTVGFFAIDFTPVTFSGSQFSLYLSKDGFASIDAGDIKYAGIFNVVDLSAAYPKTVQTAAASNNGTFLSGLVDGQKILQGPLPVKISSDYKYIKVFDGSTTAVAVSLATVTILPGITVSPGTGSAGIAVTVSGGGFASAAAIAINYTYSFTSWAGVTTTHNGTWISSGITNNGGWFSQSATMLDTKQAFNPTSGVVATTTITFTAVNATKLSSHFTSGAGDATFTSSNRVFDQLFSYFSGAVVASANAGPYGNDTGSGTVLPILNAHPTGSLGLEGNFTNAGSTVTLTIGSATATATSDVVSGAYVLNVTLPNLPLGHNTVTVVDNGVTYEFTINIVPTLVLTPTSGPIGTTVSLTAYGFPANNVIWIYWQCNSFVSGCVSGGGTAYNVVNATTGSDGAFTGSVSFVVVHTFGGAHSVIAVANSTVSFPGASLAAATVFGDETADATFTVTPTCSVSPSSVGNDGSTITASCSGVAVWNTNQDELTVYGTNIDNQGFFPSSPQFDRVAGEVAPNVNGDLSVSFFAAGFRPGMHVFSLAPQGGPIYGQTFNDGAFTPYASALFNITTAGDPIAAQITALGTTISGLQSSITSIQSSITSLQSSITSLQSSLTTLQSSFTTVSNDVTGLSSQLTTISNNVSALGTQLTSMASTLTTIQSTLGQVATSASSAATNAQAAATAATNAANGNSTAQTYVLVVAVLAAITLVLELAILVRKLS